jgi:4-hydroxy-2-oxoheptanedioate aldolase
MKPSLPFSLVGVALVSSLVHAQAPAPSYTPTRINKAIELLDARQPVYYATATNAGYDEGKAMAQTTADYINYEMEHGTFDFAALRAFMQGLVDGGPTKSGHRTPAVVVTLPILGLDEASVRANHWVIHQALAAGVHGILLCHARVPEAARVMVEATRYPFAPAAEGLAQGLRGSGSQNYAAQIWGVPSSEYLRRADVWPLNPEGEILLGVKIEDSYALDNAERTTRVPGIAFAEWGPGDMGFWLVGLPQGRGGGGARGAAGGRGGPAAGPGRGRATPPPQPAVLQQARARVLNATKAAGILFLNTCNASDVTAMLAEGVMICAGTGGAEAGRAQTKRQMPW